MSRSQPAILYAGRVSKEKGLDLLPDMQARLRMSGSRHRFVIVGSGPMLSALKARMPGAVFTGPLDREAVATAFASADVFVFPSRTDTAGNVVLEAQPSGLPVLVSNVGGPRENMIDGETGCVIDSQDPRVWADTIGRLLSDDDRLGALSAGARAYGRSRSWDAALAPLYRTYRELAAVTRPSYAPRRLPAPRMKEAG